MYHVELISKGTFALKTNMPRKANFIFEVRIRISEAFTLDSIVRNPRTFKPKDVQSACQNNELVLTHGEPTPEVTALATYVMTDFFAMAHATGLYNRQRSLWESLSQVNTVHVEQLTTGIFRKEPLSLFDFSFRDYKGKTLLSALLVSKLPDKKDAVTLLKSYISRFSGKTGHGALACFPAPMPADVLEYVRKQTHTEDPIAKYESVMPGLNRPFDLVEMHESDLMDASPDVDETLTEMRTIFQLVHPDLRKKATPTLPSHATRPKAKVKTEDSSENLPEGFSENSGENSVESFTESSAENA